MSFIFPEEMAARSSFCQRVCSSAGEKPEQGKKKKEKEEKEKEKGVGLKVLG